MSREPRQARPMRAPRASARMWAAAVTIALLAGCASSGAPTEPVEWDTTLDLGTPGEVIDTVRGVTFYPACGNEVLEFEGKSWFPFQPANADQFPRQPAALGGPPLGFARASAPVMPVVVRDLAPLPQVAAPGPGDDTGTLTVYEEGFASWVSDNGELQTWLTTVEIEYSWVC